MKRTPQRESMMATFTCAVRLSINTCFLYIYGFVCVCFVDLVNMHVFNVETIKARWKEHHNVKAWWQPLPVRCTTPFLYKYMLSAHIWSCMCLFGRSGEYAWILCRNIRARWKEHHNVKAWWQPLPVRCTTTFVYKYMFSVHIWLCMCLFGGSGEYACILIETSKPDEKNTTTWKHDGNLYLCGARRHLSMNTCFLYIYGYVCVCLVDLVNMHVFHVETSKADEKNTTT